MTKEIMPHRARFALDCGEYPGGDAGTGMYSKRTGAWLWKYPGNVADASTAKATTKTTTSNARVAKPRVGDSIRSTDGRDCVAWSSSRSHAFGHRCGARLQLSSSYAYLAAYTSKGFWGQSTTIPLRPQSRKWLHRRAAGWAAARASNRACALQALESLARLHTSSDSRRSFTQFDN